MHKRGMRGKYSRETSLGNDILRLSEWVAVSSMEDVGVQGMPGRRRHVQSPWGIWLSKDAALPREGTSTRVLVKNSEDNGTY